MSTIIETIKLNMDDMSKGHKAIASYILENYEKVAYMTAAKLASSVGVSESTVVRFTTELGFEGYPHFQKAFKEELKSKLTSVQRLNATERFADDSAAVHDIMQADIDNLKETLAAINEESFNSAVNAFLNAKHIYLMGLRASSPLSSFMYFYMTVLFDDVIHISSNSANEVFEQILPISEGDVMIGISFPRYSQRTVNSMSYAKKRGATVIAITDKENTVMTDNSDIALLAKSSMASFVDSLSAPLSLINALLVTLGIHRKEHIKTSFEALEELWSEYGVYEDGDRSGRSYTNGDIL